MPSAVVASVHELFGRMESFDGPPIDLATRRAALERFFSVPSGREKPGRFWRLNFETIVPVGSAIDASAGGVTVESGDPGIVVADLAAASREHPQLFARAFGTTGIAATKFGALSTAFACAGAFIYVPADRACDRPVVITCDAPAGTAIFPWNVVLAERGSRVTVVERIQAQGDAFVCSATEIVSEDHADVTYAVLQQAGQDAQVISNRAARPGRDATVSWALAELGGRLAAGDVSVAINAPGAHANVTALFFPSSSQHVDLISTVAHQAGDATSQTLVKSAATQRGQARFLGNIRIAPHAQGSDARLRDDALLLSATAHIDSVPALEIAANDVKAYHGATVGAIDADQIFYMESRGLERAAAERMIALGFFEPAIESFPTAPLRDEIRDALAAKLS